MQALKITFVLVFILALTRYIPVYYISTEYSEFVRHETAHARSERQLKQSLLNEAREHSLPVKESDIDIKETDNVLRVTVDYRVPLNMLIFNHELKFRAIGSGLLPGR
jgi:hypothetical protein